MADKSLLVGDDAADLLLEYAALLAQLGRGDSVSLRAVGADGDEVTAGFLLNGGTTLLVESTRSSLPEPDNERAVEYMRGRIGSASRFHGWDAAAAAEHEIEGER
jgi:hypothetical protein